MKMEPIVRSETSAIRTQTPGNYPKRNNLQVNSVRKDSNIFRGFSAIVLKGSSIFRPESKFSQRERGMRITMSQED